MAGAVEDAHSIGKYLSCDVRSGELRWLVTRGNARAGAIAGSVSTNGYRYVLLRRKGYLAHRLVWLFAHGAWPEKKLDHINGNRMDNRLENLREVSNEGNGENMRRATAANKLGVLGVCQTPNGRYAAHIRYAGKRHHLGTFDTPELAHSAYLKAKRENHAACTI